MPQPAGRRSDRRQRTQPRRGDASAKADRLDRKQPDRAGGQKAAELQTAKPKPKPANLNPAPARAAHRADADGAELDAGKPDFAPPPPPALARPDRLPRGQLRAAHLARRRRRTAQSQLPPPGRPADATYSIAEIQEAGRGLFGTITAQFAGAINYAFQNFGQPNAYMTGNEGGAAFLAGLRYGKGRLHVKNGPESEIYWQGPSAGFDFGAEGSNALFLVYNLEDPYQIYGRFSGIGGSAYVAGGVGLNVLGKGKMVMVPIRSGIGLRIGANLAYLKFTERQTWNPF